MKNEFFCVKRKKPGCKKSKNVELLKIIALKKMVETPVGQKKTASKLEITTSLTEAQVLPD